MTKKNHQKKSSSSSLVILLILLAAVVAFGLYRQHKAASLNPIVLDYVLYKQEIGDILGKDIQIEDAGESPQKIHLRLKGEAQAGELTAKLQFKQEYEFLTDIALKTDAQERKLSPLYVRDIDFYAASLSSAPLNEPVFQMGEEIFLQIHLGGLSPDVKKTKIVQSLNIYDAENSLIAGMDEIARYESKEYKPVVTFTDKISTLSFGSYFLQMIFKDVNTGQIETHWQEIRVRKTVEKNLVVKFLRYFEDPAHQIKKTEPVFAVNKPFYLSMALDGFQVKDKKISGIVDMQILNSSGETVAKKPKFAAFTKDYDPDAEILISGNLELSEPDIYFLVFQVKDFFAHKQIKHEEKILISLSQAQNGQPPILPKK